MQTLIMADLHLSSNPRDAYRHTILDMLATTAQRMGIARTFILGDLTEEKDRHNDWLVNQVVRHIRNFAALGRVYILQGNHDSLSDPDMPFFHFLRHVPDVRWIGRPTTFVAKGIGRIVFLPHTRNYKEEWDGVSFDDAAYIFAHGTFAGASMGSGLHVPHGIPHNIFPRGARVISGDVHIPHRTGRITYVGAPYTIDFGDDYQARVLVIDGDKVKSVDVKGPQKRLIELTNGVEGLQVKGASEGDIVKVKLHLPRKDAGRWPELRNMIRETCTKLKFIVHSIVPVITEEPGKRVQLTQAVVKSDEQIMDEFGRHRGVDHRTLKFGRRFL